MLVLSRKLGERIVIGEDISVVVTEIRGDKVRLGFDAPDDVLIDRLEVSEARKRDATSGDGPRVQ